jgi:asparaginyl-tRNA synthetase
MNDDLSGEDNFCFQQFSAQKKEIQIFRSFLLYKTILFFNERGFMFIDPPILHEHIKNRSEVITVSLQDRKYDLNASNALYISTYATVFENVFTISPAIRIEKPSDNHLIEFRMLECESSNSDFQQCIELTQNYIKFICEVMKKQFKESIFEERLCLLYDELVFNIITYKEIISLLKTNGISIKYGDDLSDSDLEISKILHNPTFIIDYPCPPATWTALPKNDTTNTYNLMLPDGFGELAEGGQRNNDWTFFRNKFEQLGLSSLSWYADAIEKNSCIRSGFGLGIERLISWLIGIHQIRDTVLFYR